MPDSVTGVNLKSGAFDPTSGTGSGARAAEAAPLAGAGGAAAGGFAQADADIVAANSGTAIPRILMIPLGPELITRRYNRRVK